MARLSPLEEDVLPRFRDAARAILGERFVSLVLFGSRARGDSDEDSDVDLLVVACSFTPAEASAIEDAAAGLAFESELRLSVLVRDEMWLATDQPVVREIAREGVPL